MIKSIDFGFIFARVLSFYGLGSVRTVLELPLKTFWMLHKNIDRIRAEQDLRTAEVAALTQDGEGFKKLLDDRREEMGRVIEIDQAKRVRREIEETTFDRAGLKALANMNKAG